MAASVAGTSLVRAVYTDPSPDGGVPVRNLNELEYVRDEVFANV
jgi:glutamine cyclotransferase